MREARKTAGRTQQEAADYLGVTNDTIKNWEKGYTDPRAYQLIALALFYGCSAWTWLQGLEEATRGQRSAPPSGV